jgi:hypothetical protein
MFNVRRKRGMTKCTYPDIGTGGSGYISGRLILTIAAMSPQHMAGSHVGGTITVSTSPSYVA